VQEAGEAAASDLTKAVPELATKVTLAPGTKHAVTTGLSSRVLNLMGMEGLLVRGRPKGRWTSSQHRWASLADRLGAPLAALPVEEARAELVRRWLDRFGPGMITDLKWWTGWTMGATRAAVTALDTEEVALDDGSPALVLSGDADPVPDPEPWVALLPGLDPTPMGWKERAWYLGDHQAQVFDSTGNVGPTIWVDGRIAGGWAHLKTGRVAVHLLEDVGTERAAMVEAAAAALEARLGPDRILPRFPSPLDRHLSA
jgi:Winged helix DNA-binding domain